MAFDGGSNQSIITKEFAARKKLKKVVITVPVITVPVIGFRSPEPEMREMFEVPLRASGKQHIIIRAVAEEAIHNGPAAKCPDNISWRFMQSRNAKAWDLHQPGGAIDICLGMDYPFLQPRHLKKEFRGGQLHLYTSVFGGGLIPQGVELPEVKETVNRSSMEVTALDKLPVSEEAMEDSL